MEEDPWAQLDEIAGPDENEPLRGTVTDDSVMTLPEEEGLTGIRVTDDSIWTEEAPQEVDYTDPWNQLDQVAGAETGPVVNEEEKVRILTEMTNRGASKAEIVAYLSSIGQRLHPGSEKRVDEYERMRQQGLPAQLTWAPIEDVTSELGEAESGDPVINPNANSFQAALIGAGDSILFGNLDEATAGVNAGLDWLTGENTNFSENYTNRRNNYRAILRGLEEYNGKAMLAGQVGGGFFMPGGSLYRGASGLGRAGIAGAQGAAYGQGSSNSETLSGQAADAGIGATIGVVADRGLNRIGAVVSPRIDPAVRQLRELGANLTPGQLLGPLATRIERGVANTYLPGTAPIREARERSQESLSRVVANDALVNIGETVPRNIPDRVVPDYVRNTLERRRSDILAELDDEAQQGMESFLRNPPEPGFTGGQATIFGSLKRISDPETRTRLANELLSPQTGDYGPRGLETLSGALRSAADDNGSLIKILRESADPADMALWPILQRDVLEAAAAADDQLVKNFPTYDSLRKVDLGDGWGDGGVSVLRNATALSKASRRPMDPQMIGIAEDYGDDAIRFVRGEVDPVVPQSGGDSPLRDNLIRVYGDNFDGSLNRSQYGPLDRMLTAGSAIAAPFTSSVGFVPGATTALYSPLGTRMFGSMMTGRQGQNWQNARKILETLSPAMRQVLVQSGDYDQPQ